MARKSRQRILNTETMTYCDSSSIATINEPSKAAIYARLSIEDNRLENGTSLDNQISCIKKALNNFSDVEIVKVYSDNGFSGTNFKRKGWEQLIDDIRAGKINCIAVKDLSRLGRNSVEAGNYLEKVFPFLNVRFISINDNYDSKYDNYSKSMLENAFKNLMNEFYSRDVSRKVNSAIAARRKMGYIVSGKTAYGYKKSADHKQLLPDENTAFVVIKIFEWIAAGKRICEVVDILNTLAIPSPSKYLYLQSGGKKHKKHANCKWYSNTIEHILENETYTGKLIQNKSHTSIFNGNVKTYHNKEDWLVIENAHTALVSKEVFDLIQKRKEGNTKNKNEINLLKNKIFCGKCGACMTKRKYKTNISYNCRSHYRSFKEICHVSVNSNEIKSTISSLFDKYEKMYVDISALALRIYNSSKYKAETDKLNKEIICRSNELRAINGRLAGLYEDYKRGLVTAKDFEYIKLSYKNEYAQTNELLSELKLKYEKAADIKNIGKHLSKITDEINKAKNDEKFLYSLIKSIIVYPERRMEIEFVFGDVFSDTLDYLSCWEVSE